MVVRTREFRRKTREDVVREYFYGKNPWPLSPFSFEVSFSDVEIFKIGGDVNMQGLLPHYPLPLLLPPQLLQSLTLHCHWEWREKMAVLC